MHTHNRTMLAAAMGVALGIAAPSVGRAQQQRELFRWAGRVDQEIQLTMSGRNLTASNIGPSEPGQRRSNVESALPRMDGQVTVQLENGRGSVDVLRQPTARNGYTTVIRIRDPQGGADNYRLNVLWQPVAAGDVMSPFDRADIRGRGRGRYGMNGNGMNRTALRWSGDVDDNLEIQLRPGSVNYRTIRGAVPRNVQAQFGGLPNDVRQIVVQQTEGRGQVVVVQQPTPQNGYLALLRVRDPQGGYGHYAFDVTWR